MTFDDAMTVMRGLRRKAVRDAMVQSVRADVTGYGVIKDSYYADAVAEEIVDTLMNHIASALRGEMTTDGV